MRGTLTEEIVVDMAYVDHLRGSKSRQVELFAREFLEEERHRLSRYFACGVHAMRSDIASDGARRLFPEVLQANVLDLMEDGARVDIAGVASSIPGFLPLKLATRVDSVMVVQDLELELTRFRCVPESGRVSVQKGVDVAHAPEFRREAVRLYRNTLVFLAADKARLQDLDEALRKFLAWKSILAEKETLNLDPHQVRQAETQMQAADGAVTARLRILEVCVHVAEITDRQPFANPSGSVPGGKATLRI